MSDIAALIREDVANVLEHQASTDSVRTHPANLAIQPQVQADTVESTGSSAPRGRYTQQTAESSNACKGGAFWVTLHYF